MAPAEPRLAKPVPGGGDDAGRNQTERYSYSPASSSFSAAPWDTSDFDLDDALTSPEMVVHSPRDSIGRSDCLPTPADVVSSMPTVTDDAGVCAICMEEIGVPSGGKRTHCSHVYHGDCVSQWLVRDASCPLCRCQIRAE